MDPDYGRSYRALYRHHWWWRARESVILEVLREHLPATAWCRALDVGCGDGLLLEQLETRGAEVRGVEADSAVMSPDGPYGDRIHVGPFDETYEPDGRFTLITMLDVLEHLPDPLVALRHARRLAEPGAWWLVTVPAFRALWTQHDVLNRHYTRYTRRTLAELLTRGGLEIVRLEYFFHWLLPMKLAVRLKERVTHADPTVPRIPPAPINRALYWLSRLERATVGRLRVIGGSSLLACGRFPNAGGSAR